MKTKLKVLVQVKTKFCIKPVVAQLIDQKCLGRKVCFVDCV